MGPETGVISRVVGLQRAEMQRRLQASFVKLHGTLVTVKLPVDRRVLFRVMSWAGQVDAGPWKLDQHTIWHLWGTGR